jgi:H+/Cl- antiporter ClcA
MIRRSITAAYGLVLAICVGVVGGLISASFIGSLNWATTTRTNHSWLIVLMPIGGFVVGLLYHYLGQSVVAGNNLVIDELHEPGAGVPGRMAPLVYGGSVASHLVGASVGREGAAVQIIASITDAIARIFKPSEYIRRLLLVSAIAAGFGGMFGVPVAGAIFAIEVQRRGLPKFDFIAYALAASVVGDRVVSAISVHHLLTPSLEVTNFNFALLWRLLIASVVFACVATTFIKTIHALRDQMAKWISWSPIRPVIGAIAILALTAIADSRAYLGLSTQIAEAALLGAAGLAALAFLWKFLFTTVSLGTGFVGGEVLPIFIIGALVGAQTGRLLDASIPLFAALGFVGVFAAAANTPLACLVIGIELFGSNAILPMAIVCALAYGLSGTSSIYSAQRL